MRSLMRHPGLVRFRLAALVATAVMLLAVAGCSLPGMSGDQSSPANRIMLPPATPDPPSGLPPTVRDTLGPPPKNCPVAPPTHTLSVPDFGGGFSSDVTFSGGHPAWELGIGTDGVLAVQGTPFPGSKIMWVVGPNIHQPVTLSGRDLRSGLPLWFDMYPPNVGGGIDYFTTSAVLDPSLPNRGDTTNSKGHWNIWGIGVIVSAASCYQLDVTSPVGSWHTVFAAGTVPLGA